MLSFFPELEDETFKVGYTQMLEGMYVWKTSPDQDFEYLRLSECCSYYVIAHELTHVLQHRDGRIPKGEKACDIWTLARSYKYVDRIPGYLKIPHRVRTHLYEWVEMLNVLARASIKKREEGERYYIKWFEDTVNQLSEEVSRKENVQYLWMADLWQGAKNG